MSADSSTPAGETGSASPDWIIYLAERFPLLVWAVVIVGLLVIVGVFGLFGYVILSGQSITTKWFTISGRLSRQALNGDMKTKLEGIGEDLGQVRGALNQRVKDLREEENSLTINRSRLHNTHGTMGDTYGGRVLLERIRRCQEEMNAAQESIRSKLENVNSTLREILRKFDN